MFKKNKAAALIGFGRQKRMIVKRLISCGLRSFYRKCRNSGCTAWKIEVCKWQKSLIVYEMVVGAWYENHISRAHCKPHMNHFLLLRYVIFGFRPTKLCTVTHLKSAIVCKNCRIWHLFLFYFLDIYTCYSFKSWWLSPLRLYFGNQT